MRPDGRSRVCERVDAPEPEGQGVGQAGVAIASLPELGLYVPNMYTQSGSNTAVEGVPGSQIPSRGPARGGSTGGAEGVAVTEGAAASGVGSAGGGFESACPQAKVSRSAATEG